MLCSDAIPLTGARNWGEIILLIVTISLSIAVRIYSLSLILAMISAAVTALCMSLANGDTKTKRIPVIARKVLS